MNWHRITISESCILGGEYHRLCRAFQKAFIAAGAPADMALLAERVDFGDTRRVYLSPSSIRYLNEALQGFEVEACGCPRSDQVTLVYGVPGVKAELLQLTERLIEETSEMDLPAPIIPMLPSRLMAVGHS